MLNMYNYVIAKQGQAPGQPASYAPIHAQLDSFITRQVHGIAIVIEPESPFASLPPPLLPALRPSRLLRVPLLAAATAEDQSCLLLLLSAQAACHCCLQCPMLQPTSNSSVGKWICVN